MAKSRTEPSRLERLGYKLEPLLHPVQTRRDRIYGKALDELYAVLTEHPIAKERLYCGEGSYLAESCHEALVHAGIIK